MANSFFVCEAEEKLAKQLLAGIRKGGGMCAKVSNHLLKPFASRQFDAECIHEAIGKNVEPCTNA